MRCFDPFFPTRNGPAGGEKRIIETVAHRVAPSGLIDHALSAQFLQKGLEFFRRHPFEFRQILKRRTTVGETGKECGLLRRVIGLDHGAQMLGIGQFPPSLAGPLDKSTVNLIVTHGCLPSLWLIHGRGTLFPAGRWIVAGADLQALVAGEPIIVPSGVDDAFDVFQPPFILEGQRVDGVFDGRPQAGHLLQIAFLPDSPVGTAIP